MITMPPTLTGERADLLDALTTHRELLVVAATGLTDAQAALAPTASELCIGGIVKHVTRTEKGWGDFMLRGPTHVDDLAEAHAAHEAGFVMRGDDTLAGLLADYEAVAMRTDEIVAGVDLDSSHPLPEAPWYAPGARWTARRVIAHIVAETAQHAGHADIIRETIDGQRSMG